VLYVNPGSAGRRRFSLPISVGELLVDGGQVQVRLMTLDAQ
jgi:predicted phosphodiesterase